MVRVAKKYFTKSILVTTLLESYHFQSSPSGSLFRRLAAIPVDEHDVLDPHAARAATVKAGLDRYQLAFQELRPLEVQQRRLVDIQPDAMAGAVGHGAIIVSGVGGGSPVL